ncbi:xanthohumol 4-O-methyltransferase-like [Rutidosis leptorrhynchoides]|uniref:xanthohumol 4-O-methyltransferase-like n=1 Tax=Rutidosis leptorrhynchoides TaxID=125765 RepID=UPI003A9A2493
MDHQFEDEILAQATIFKCLAGIAHYMTIRCALDLRLADILHSHNGPMTLSHLASSIESSTPPNKSILKCIMRLLVRNKIFAAHEPSSGTDQEPLYEATKVSSLLRKDNENSPFAVFSSIPPEGVTWCFLSQCVKEGGTAFEKILGCTMYEFASQNPEFNKGFNNNMAVHTKIQAESIVSKLGDVVKNVKSLVNVGGGIEFESDERSISIFVCYSS